MAARCVGVLSKIATMETMNVFLEHVLPWLGAIDDNTKQEGAIEALACILCMSQMKFKLFSWGKKCLGISQRCSFIMLPKFLEIEQGVLPVWGQ